MLYFDIGKFSKDCKRKMAFDGYSYRTLASDLKMTAHSRLHRILHNRAKLRVSEFMALCNELELNPFEYIEETEVQLSFWSE